MSCQSCDKTCTNTVVMACCLTTVYLFVVGEDYHLSPPLGTTCLPEAIRVTSSHGPTTQCLPEAIRVTSSHGPTTQCLPEAIRVTSSHGPIHSMSTRGHQWPPPIAPPLNVYQRPSEWPPPIAPPLNVYQRPSEWPSHGSTHSTLTTSWYVGHTNVNTHISSQL